MSPEAPTMVSSEADMFAAVPSDAFETAGTELPDVTEGVDEAPEIDVPAEEPVAEPEPEPETEAAPEPEPADVQQEALPEGVKRGKDRNGKEGMWLTPQRYETFHGAHKAVQALSEIVGQPITPDILGTMHGAYLAQERLFNDFLSGDQASQTNLVTGLLDEAVRARNEGEITGNPVIPFTQQYMTALKTREPEAYDAALGMAAKDIVEQLYTKAAQSGDRNLFLSLGHAAAALGLPFKKEAEMQAFFAGKGQPDPLSQAQSEIQSLKAQLTGKSSNSQAEQFASWKAETGKSVYSGILDNAVKPAVETLKDQGYWKTHPEAFEHHVLNRLHSEVKNVITQDGRFNQTIQLLDQQAQRASAQRREAISAQIKEAYVNRAKLAVDSIKGKVLKDAADWAVTNSKSRTDRLQASQSQRGPKSNGQTVPKSLVPNSIPNQAGKRFDPNEQAALLSKLMAT
jgi:hypothetical protein